jgi:hypothetical protein
MGETLIQGYRVSEEDLYCKTLSVGTKMTVPTEEAPANSVPAAAVRQRVQALFGIIGRKARVGCFISHMLNVSA